MHKTSYYLAGLAVLALAAIISARFFRAQSEPGYSPPATSRVADSPEVADEVQQLLSTHGCLGCHAVDRKLVGPAYRDVAARYTGDDRALEKVTASILHGGAERWGDVPMPAMPDLTEAQARQLAVFVLQQ
jgi:cytochrome c551/c552